MTNERLTWEQIKDMGWQGDAALYKLSRPISYYNLTGEGPETVDHVIVSAVDNDFTIETYIFPAYADGSTVNMCEMAGSFKGGMDHEHALKRLADSLVY